MSFPRAKIQRFNDVSNDVPSPTKYDPKLGDKVKGGCILKSDTKPCSNLENSKSVSTPIFRTPLIPKKHSCLGASSEKSIPTSFRSIPLKQEDFDFLSKSGEPEELSALKIECKNKNETIADLEKLVEDLRLQISDHEKTKTKLECCIAELEATKSTLECITSNHDNYEQQIKHYEEKIKDLEEQIETLGKAKEELLLKSEETEKKNNKLEEINLDCERKIISLEGTIEQLQAEVENNKKAIADLKHNEEVHEKNYKVSVECLKGKISALDNEIKELEKNKSQNEATIFGLETQVSTLNVVIENLKKENGDVENTKTELSDKLTETEEVLKQQKEAYNMLSKQLDDCSSEFTKLLDENKQLRCEFDTYKSESCKEKNMLLEKNMDILASQEKKLKEMETDHSSKLELLNKEINDLTCKMMEEQEKIKEKEEEFSATYTVLKNTLESKISSLEEELINKEKEFRESLKELQDETDSITRNHAEDVHIMQKMYETKLLEQMQEYTEKINTLQEYIDEKEARLKETNQKYLRLTAEAKTEYDCKLKEKEDFFNNLMKEMESKHLAELNKLKEENIKQVESIESERENVILAKDKEVEVLQERYNGVVDEMQNMLNDINKKEEEIKKLTATNDTLNGRLKILMEEIKLLNAENKTKCNSLQETVLKYENEALKNTKLSEKLGELDCKIAQQREELKARVAEEEKLTAELRKCKEANSSLHTKNYDLEITVVELKDIINNLRAKIDTERADAETKLQEVNIELATVRKQCHKFNIAMTDTRKSLEALGERLIESETEVEKLTNEKQILKVKLDSVEKERNEIEKKFSSLQKVHIETEEKLLKFKEDNEELAKKCNELELSCKDFEQNVARLTEIKEELESDRKCYDQNIQTLKNLIKTQELQLIETERETLNQVGSVHKVLMEKVEFFSQFWLEKNQDLMSKSKKLKEECEEVKSLLKLKTEEYENLATDNEILKTSSEITMKECETLKKQCGNQTCKIEELETKLKQLTTESNTMEDKLFKTEEDLRRLNEEYEIMSEKLSKNMELIDDLTAERENDRKTQLDLESELEEKTKKMKDMEENLEEAEIKIKAIETDLIKKSEELENKEEDIRTYEEENSELQQKIEKEHSMLEEITLELETVRCNIEILESTNKESNKMIESLTQANRDLETKNIQLENEKRALAEIKESLENTCLNEQKRNNDMESDYKNKYETLNVMKNEIEERKEYYKSHCMRLQTLLDELMAEKTEVQKDFDEIHGILQIRDKKIEELEKSNAELHSLIGPFRDQLSQYETERMLIENDREQLRKQHLEQAAKLGHQNHKQKIQHVVKLKDELLRLRKENEKLTLEVKNSKKQIEKLREQVGDHPKRLFIGGKRPASTPFKGKENNSTLLSPNAGIITPMSIKQEPISPGNPLRERSQPVAFTWKK